MPTDRSSDMPQASDAEPGPQQDGASPDGAAYALERNSAELEELARQTVAGADLAAHQLVQALWPSLRRLVTRSSAMRGWADSDDVVNVLVQLVEKVLTTNSPALASYFDWKQRNLGKSFGDWVRIVTANAARDYARSRRPQLKREVAVPLTSPAHMLNEFLRAADVSHASVRPPYTNKQTAKQLMAFAAESLDARQAEVLRLWLQGSTFEEIAASCAASSSEVQKALRAAIARLRRKFSEELD